MIRNIGYILFLGGTAGALITAVSPNPLSLYFFISSLTGASGAVMVRFSMNKTKAEANISEFKGYRQILETVNSEIQIIIEGIISDLFPIDKIKTDIENIQNLIIEFHDSEKVIIEEIGLLKASEIISAFAAGERFLSRAWSALVDGYFEEMKNSLTESSSYFRETLNKMQ